MSSIDMWSTTDDMWSTTDDGYDDEGNGESEGTREEDRDASGEGN